MAHTQKHRSKTLIRDMVRVAQAAKANPEYGLSDADTETAIRAAFAIQDKEKSKPCGS